MPNLRLAFLGFGNVGQALLTLLLEKTEELRARHSIEWSLVGVAGRRLGSAIDPRGIDPLGALELAKARRPLAPLSAMPLEGDGVAFVGRCGADVLFENTPVSYEDGEPAVSHLRTALECGMHAITANKGPVVHAYRSLTALAAERGRRFMFESTVMDGAPVFSLWRECLPTARLQRFRGILNSTTNLILTLMEQGKTFEESVAHAQQIGIAESDPSGDILGWDAAVKVAALVTVLMDYPLTPQAVDRKGIDGIGEGEVLKAQRDGLRWKLVCRAERINGGVVAAVEPELLGPDDELYGVMGTSSAVTLESDVLGPLTIIEANPGPRTTAYGLLGDLVSAVRTAVV
jgi:homoserine dehydrogenase